jgi:6,7-dimethyl-8-ribityllumazine synthase
MTNQASEDSPTFVQGDLVAPSGARVAIVAGRFNDFIVARLIDGALDALARHGVALGNVTVVRVPGSWEIPLTCSRIAAKRRVDAIVALGCVIRGSTPHFDHVAAEVSKGIASVSLSTGIPIGFGVLMADTIEQAIDRAGTKMGNKGWDGALSAIEMLSVLRALDAKKP